MAQCKQAPQEFIKNAFTPQVAVMCSPAVEKACQKNKLSFIELCQPFCKLNSDVHYKDPTGNVITIRNLKISFLDVNSRPPQLAVARKYLNSAVTDAPDPRLQTNQFGECTLEVPSSAPWFEAWRETFLQVQFPSDHEYTKHFLACVLVVSSSDNAPVETMINLAQSLNQMQSVTPNKLPKWFSSNILRYYVILHDNVDAKEDVAMQALEAMKVSYGANNCFLLRMNSRAPGHIEEQLPDPWSQFISNRIDTSIESKITPENSPLASRANALEIGQEASETGNTLTYHPLSPDIDDNYVNDSLSEREKSQRKLITNTLHGACLSTNDVEEVKMFVHEFCTHALLPYIEKQVQQLSDVVSNKKGVSRSLFSATKRWFAPNKPGSTLPVNNLIYSPDSPELQMRRLGDLHFMFGNYSLAYQAYHAAKRDFNVDQAWLYYAGALEMAALSAFMANEATRKTSDYLEESITTYLTTCKMAQFATRATLLSAECLKSKGLYGEAAHHLIRMTSEDSDLRSALLLEQAAYCFLQSKPAMLRKYAFHMVLAGHRFSKAAQRKHSLRSYKQAHQVYRGKGWNLAEDHIHYTIGRQANNLNRLDEAVESFARLLSGQSRQPAHQQTLFLKEYITIFSMLQKTSLEGRTDILPLPVLKNDSIKILVGPTPPLSTPGKIPATGVVLGKEDLPTPPQRWNKLEEILVQEAQGFLPAIFKPATTLYTIENFGTAGAIAVTNEPIQVSIRVCNTLQIVLNLKDIHLLWDFKPDAPKAPGEDAKEVSAHLVKSLVLQPNSQQELVLTVTPLLVGKLTLNGLCYSLLRDEAISVRGRQLFDFKGAKVQDGKKEIGEISIAVVPPAPCLQVTFSEINSDVLCNEIQKVTMDLRNVGNIPLHKVCVATSVPELLSTCEFSNNLRVNSAASEGSSRDKMARRNHVTHVPLPQGRLDPGRCQSVDLWLRAPDQKGPAMVDLLIYYENVDSKSVPRYRLVRHIWKMSVQESISLDAMYFKSSICDTAEQLTVSIKVTNLNKVHNTVLTEISLMKAALLSPCWRLLEEILIPKKFLLHSQETVHIVLKCRRIAEKQPKYSEITFDACKKEFSRASQAAYLSFAEKSRQSNLNVFDDAEQRKPENGDGSFMLVWHSNVVDAGKKRAVGGQTVVPIRKKKADDAPAKDYDGPIVFYDEIRLLETSTNNMRDVRAKLQEQVTYNLKHPGVLRHDFGKAKVCIVPVQLVLHSVTNTENLYVIVNTLGTSSDSPAVANKPTLFYPYSSKHFRWVGAGGLVKALRPYSSRVVPLCVGVLAPGTYDLGARLEVLCYVGRPDDAIAQTCRAESALVVIDGNS